jgi:hypothetical protein
LWVVGIDFFRPIAARRAGCKKIVQYAAGFTVAFNTFSILSCLVRHGGFINMAITFTDKLRIVCHVCDVFEERKFIEAYVAQQEKMGLVGDPGQARSNRRQYFKDTTPHPNGQPRKILVGMLKERAKKFSYLGDIASLLDSTMTTPQFIEKCRVRFPDLETNKIVTADASQDWKNRYNGLHFMERLDEFEEQEDGKKLLEAMLGTYHLYRRHSVLPGVLREVVVVKERRYGHAEGVYYQYKRGKPGEWNEIDFNVFFAGFYVLAFGAFKTEEREVRTDDAVLKGSDKAQKKALATPQGAELRHKTRTEILEIKILIENALRIDGGVNCEQNVFPGILTGIYDYGNILLAERILVRRICGATERPEHMKPERLLPDDKPNASEYYAVLDAIDNASNGHTLSIRPIHLEKPYLLGELLPDPAALATSKEKRPPPKR